MGVTVSVWADSPQRAAMAIDRLMALRLVSGASIVRWVFASGGVRTLDDEVAGGLAWDVLYAAVDKALARTQVRILGSSPFGLTLAPWTTRLTRPWYARGCGMCVLGYGCALGSKTCSKAREVLFAAVDKAPAHTQVRDVGDRVGRAEGPGHVRLGV